MIKHKDHFHGSDLEKIEEIYGIKKEEIVSFSANVNPLGVSPLLRTTLADKIDAITTYPDREYTSLRKCIAAYCGTDHENVIVGNGSTELISLFIQIEHPKKAMIIGPTYSEYEREISLGGGTTLYYPLREKDDFRLDVNDFISHLNENIDLLVICNPNNPTGTTITKDELQVWVDYANKNGAVIIYDAAYEAYISEPDVPHTIYECEGARTCAIELRSFSKNAGFTGVRLGFTVIPKDLKCGDVTLHSLWARRHGTKFNGAPYIVQRAGEAVYSEAGQKQTGEQIAYYMNNAKTILEGLKSAGYTVSGGVNAPYIWLKTPDKMTSWEFFDYLLEKANVVGTPGSGFGPSGEGYFRLTAFGSYENTVKALERIKAL